MNTQRPEALSEAELLIITDQKDSSRNLTDDVISLTAKHFKVVLEKVKPYRNKGCTTYVVKNVGDSLMIRFSTAKPKDIVPCLVRDLLDTQVQLDEKRVHSPKVRIFLALLGEDQYVDGGSIASLKMDTTDDFLPPPRWDEHWLARDVFGPGATLAFRAAQIPKEASLVIDDKVAKWLPNYQRDAGFEFNYDGTMSIFVGREVAFSPIKGLDEDQLYKFGLSDRTQVPFWRGHLFLRTVSNDKSKIDKDSLILEQQKIRAVVRLVWPTEPDEEIVKEWAEKLYRIDSNAGYIRSVGIVDKEYPYCWWSQHLNDTAAAEIDEDETGLVMIFAGPTDSTYQKIRRAIGDLTSDPADSKPVALSTFVFPDEREDKSEFWPSQVDDGYRYIVILARWRPSHRGNPSETFERLISKSMNQFNLKKNRCGRLMGGEWDIYCFLSPRSQNMNTLTEESIREFSNLAWKSLGDSQVVGEATFFSCRQFGTVG